MEPGVVVEGGGGGCLTRSVAKFTHLCRSRHLQGAKVECSAYGPALRNRRQRAITEPFAIVIPPDETNTLSAHIVGAGNKLESVSQLRGGRRGCC